MTRNVKKRVEDPELTGNRGLPRMGVPGKKHPGEAAGVQGIQTRSAKEHEVKLEPSGKKLFLKVSSVKKRGPTGKKPSIKVATGKKLPVNTSPGDGIGNSVVTTVSNEKHRGALQGPLGRNHP